MAKLTLKPSIKDYSREELEAFLESIRVKRMTAAVAYFANKNEKLAAEQSKVERKYEHERLMLEKELERIDTAVSRAEARMIRIDELLQEMGELTEQFTDITPDTAEDDE